MRKGRCILVLVVASIFSLTACAKKSPCKVTNGRDAILFERATTAVKEERFTVANLALQTLVATYPDSEYADRAKRMLTDPRIARCGGVFSSTPASHCDPEAPRPGEGQ